MSHSSPYTLWSGRAELCLNPTSKPCKFFPHGTCEDGEDCHHRHDPSDVTQLELCEEFWLSGGCHRRHDCPLAHVLHSGKVLYTKEYTDRWTKLLSLSEMPTRHTEHELPGLASNNVPRLQQPKRRLPELDHDDGDKVSAPSAKRNRRRKNKGIILRQAWNYIDWEIRRLRRDGELDWEALFNGEILDPKFVTRRTNEVVGLTEQTLRSHGKSKGPAPERPSDCIVRKKRTHLSATTDPSRSAVPLDESRKPFPYHDFVQHDDSPPTIEFEPKLGRGLELDDQAPSASRSSRSEPPLSVSENERRESILLSFTRARKPTAPYTVQKHWGPTLFNAADQQQDDKCGSVTMTAIPIRMGHADWHKSPENSPAVPRRSLPIQFKTAAAPAISTVSAVSSLAKLSWDPNNTPFRSPSSSMLTRSSAQFIQCSSVGSKAYQDLLSMSFKMESLSLRS